MKTVLGTWRVGSGNNCTMVLSEDGARGVRINAVWRDAPTADDDEEFHFRVLPEAWEMATVYIEQHAAIIKVLHELEAEGLIKKVGVRDGKWVWRRTERMKRGAVNGATEQEVLQ